MLCFTMELTASTNVLKALLDFEGFKCPARVTLVNTSLKYIVRDKIKVEGHVQNYDTANTGLDAHQLAEITSTRQEMTKKLSRVIDTSTIIISFDPAEDLHAIRVPLLFR